MSLESRAWAVAAPVSRFCHCRFYRPSTRDCASPFRSLEGKVYRLGEFKVEGNSIFSEDQIRAVIGLNKGDIANGEKVSKGLFENLKKFYGQQGFIEYTAEPVPTFKDNPQNPNEGIVDFTVTIEEGKQFTLRRLEFVGNTFTRDNVLRREVLINEGDIYNDAYGNIR